MDAETPETSTPAGRASGIPRYLKYFVVAVLVHAMIATREYRSLSHDGYRPSGTVKRKNKEEHNDTIEEELHNERKVDNIEAARPGELFMERLNRLLPVCPEDNVECTEPRLFPDEIARIEKELMTFQVPRPIHIRMRDAEYLSIQFWRWFYHVQDHPSESHPKCPNCNFHFWLYERGKLPEDAVADVHFDLGCLPKFPKQNRQKADQIYIGMCGESQYGSGRDFYSTWRSHFDYIAGFGVDKGSPFETTYAHLHLSPDGRFGFPELWNVTDMAKLLLRPPPPKRNDSDFTATFVHNDCGHRRGKLLARIAREYKDRFPIARYGKCLHNVERPPEVAPYDDTSCADRPPGKFFHNDCEATRDGTKTVLSSYHNFTFALENTLSPDYITEKRWEALLAGSVPIVWDHDETRHAMPDSDAAVWMPLSGDPRLPDPGSYPGNWFKWKERGLRTGFLRQLFLSKDYLFCRICEYAANQPVSP